MNFNKKLFYVFTGALVITLSGCSSTMPKGDLEQQLKMTAEENKALKSQLQSQSNELTERNQLLESYRSQSSTTGISSDLLPPDAKPGECYARVWVPEAFKNVSRKMLVKEQSERIELIPAKYETVEERVLVKEASSRMEEVPAVYGTESETLLVKPEALIWKTSLDKNGIPASQELLATAKKYGIDLDSAKPGMCYHEHYRPAQFTTEKQKVLVSEASENVDVVAAKYKYVEKQVLVSEASTQLKEIPAVYGWEEETVIDKPAHTVWKKGTGPIQRIDEATGEIMCLVEVPATYKTIRKRVLKSPARTETINIPAKYKTVKVRALAESPKEVKTEIPAQYKSVDVTKKVADASFVWHEVHNMQEPATTRTGAKICLTKEPAVYKTVKRRVVKTPASSRQIDIPAEYKTVKVRKLVSKAEEKRIVIPAEYKTITLQELDKDGYMEWRSILCETNMTGGRISAIQSALKQAGYNPGPIDGVIGEQTIMAVNAFQKDKGLPVDKYLNLETLKALGVSAR